MNEDKYDVILDSVKGKAKGVLMSEYNNYSTENISKQTGVNKFQLFLLFLCAILIGLLAFGFGYFFYKYEKDNKTEEQHKTNEKYLIGSKNTKKIIIADEKEQEITNIKNFYILIGKYSLAEEGQKVQNKLQIKAGKLAILKPTNEGVVLYIGPFESENLAKNEKNLIFQKSYIMGSITNVV
ncbi:hypothetical protein [Alphaproteobacteria bacterium endosymbiont of Tiliacea citrago]|uniref:hypothetical protein n=1 Tax=Alphaproteobacteria bacterium endosymbiont of Tiliacea citrago TaxID=3077944 RepID=UPI00313B5BF0